MLLNALLQRQSITIRLLWLLFGLISLPLSTSGCAALALTMLGVGAGVTAGTAVSYSMNGYAYRTFTAPLPEVEKAILTALARMGLKVESKANTIRGKMIQASGNEQQIEIELVAVSAKSTRIRTVAKQGVFLKDRATATEIIIQTEKLLST